MCFHVVAGLRRGRTVSRKNERLINLTIALLHTSRFLTKGEIFAKVLGYEGNNDSMERMFERDKDELRAIGIPISVAQIDPLFDDEVGYRILPQEYSLDLGALTPREISLLATISQKEDLRDLNLKVKSLGSYEDLADEVHLHLSAPLQVGDLVDYIDKRQAISFDYLNLEDVGERREVQPYALISREGDWYLVGFDLNRNDIRTFKFSRIVTPFQEIKSKPYEVPHGFDPTFYLQVTPQETALIEVRKLRGLQLRALASTVEEGDDWDRIWVEYSNRDWIEEKILWHLDDVRVVEPTSLREDIIKTLDRMIELHV